MEEAAPGLCSVLSESKRIINAHSRHFLALSVLFLLPQAFVVSVYPTIQNILSLSPTHNSKILLSANYSSFFLDNDQDEPSNLFTSKIGLLYFLFTLFLFTSSLFATGSITYIVIHGFYGRPVKLLSSIKSAFASFFPLLITVSFMALIFLGVILVFGFFFFFLIKVAELLGFEVDVHSFHFTVVSVILVVVLILVLVYLQLNWALSTVIVVAESSWGLAPLRRSRFLMKGMKGVALSLFLFFGFLSVLFAIAPYLPWSALDIGNMNKDGWIIWPLVIQSLLTSAIYMWLLLYNFAALFAALSVLYMDCKAVHGELAWEIAAEFAGDYVSLPFDDKKIPHFVSVVCA